MWQYNMLYHTGVKGMHWGTRKNRAVFISGTSKMEDTESPYYRANLPKAVIKRVDKIIKANGKILIGDCVGADKKVQEYIASRGYGNVHIYVSGNTVRNNADKNGKLGWGVHNVNADKYEKDSKEWHAVKDKAMQKEATSGLAIILDNNGASATRKNIDKLINDNKKVTIYELNSNIKKDGMKSKRKYIKERDR